jgi:hypothetical protein
MRALAPSFLVAALAFSSATSAQAQNPNAPALPPPPPPPAAPAATFTPPPAEPPPPPIPDSTPAMPVSPPTVEAGPTDHDSVVGHWGVEARQVGTFQRTAGNDPSCGMDCPIHLNALSVRRWQNQHYAWTAGLVLGLGSGSRYDTGATRNWDTYFGIGPTVGASFLLADWHHLAVSFSPGIDFVYFLPRASGAKTTLLNIRAPLEAELHLGFLGIPQLSVGITSGLVIGLRTISKPQLNPGGLASQWDIGFSGPTTISGLVSNLYLRFYL